MLLAAAATPAEAQGSRRPQARLTDFYAQWLAEVEPLLAEAERRAFERLEGPGARERFLRAFWAARPERLLERWQENREARDQLRERSPAMERAVLLAGKPAFRQPIEPCESELRRIEIWIYDGWRLEHQLGRPPPSGQDEIVLAFVQQVNFDPRSMRLWSPDSGVDLTFDQEQPESANDDAETQPAGALRVLDQAERRRCLTPTERRRLERRLGRAVSWRDFIERLGWTDGASDTGWVDRFLRVEAVLDMDAMALPGVALDFEPLGTENRRTTMRGRLRLPPEHLAAIGAGQILDRVTITGDVFLRDRLGDAFVVTHHVSGGSANIALDFFRRLPAGDYRLEIRAEDRLGRGLLRMSHSLEVPALDVLPSVPGLGLLSRRETIVLNQMPNVELLAPEGRVLGFDLHRPRRRQPGRRSGRLPAGRRDGRTRLCPSLRARPRLAGPPPPDRGPGTRRRGRAPGASRPGDRAGRTSVLHRPRAPGPGLHRGGARPVRARRRAVRQGARPRRLPSGRRTPREHDGAALPMPGSGRTAPAAELRSGRRHAPHGRDGRGPRLPRVGSTEEIEVRLVDLLVSVGGRQAGPATGLDAADFRVLHRGVEARIRDFRNLADRPLTVALLMDISSSMGRGVRVAATSAQRFFEGILTDRDAASLIVFNHDLDRLAPFSGDTRLLRYAAEGLRAWGSTRLYDGIAYAVSSFAGRPDRRALVVLSDGADTDSNLDFEPVLAQAELAGVVVYPIALRVNDPATAEALKRLADRTGGRYHVAASVEDLDRIYREIERDLRSQYLIAFEPPPGVEARADGLRDIEVDVSRAGLTVTGVRSRGR